MTTILTD